MSMEKTGEILDVTPQQISRFELGQQKISAAQLYRLARGFDVPIGWFFLGYEETSEEISRLRVVLKASCGEYRPVAQKEKQDALIRAWLALSNEKKRDAVLALTEAMLPE